jgi:hypothetical protein
MGQDYLIIQIYKICKTLVLSKFIKSCQFIKSYYPVQ